MPSGLPSSDLGRVQQTWPSRNCREARLHDEILRIGGWGLAGELTPDAGVTPAGRQADGESPHLARYYGTRGAEQGASSLDFWLLRRWLEQTELFEFVGETCTV